MSRPFLVSRAAALYSRALSTPEGAELAAALEAAGGSGFSTALEAVETMAPQQIQTVIDEMDGPTRRNLEIVAKLKGTSMVAVVLDFLDQAAPAAPRA